MKHLKYDIAVLGLVILSNWVWYELFIRTPRIELIYSVLILGIFNAVWLSNWLKIKIHQWTI